MYFSLLFFAPVVMGIILITTAQSISGSYEYIFVFGFFGCLTAFCAAIIADTLTRAAIAWSEGKRTRVAKLFRPLMVVVQICAVVITIGMGAGFVAVSFAIPAALFGKYLPKLMLFIGIAAVYATFKISKVILSIRPRAQTTVNGVLVGRSQGKELWSAVDSLAKQMNTMTPERIILSADDKICVTEADVILASGICSGRSLILSLPLFKHLTENQGLAVIAHELAHFSGGDTELSLNFFPIQTSASQAIRGLQRVFEKFGGSAIAAWPGLLLISRFSDLFAVFRSTISKACEKDADMKAAAVVGHDDLVAALVSIHGLSHLWKKFDEALFEMVHKDQKGVSNLISIFDKFIDTANVDEALNAVMISHVDHPFNSHPSLKERIEYLGESVDSVKRIGSFKADTRNTMITSIESLGKIEVELTFPANERNLAKSRYVHAVEKQELDSIKAA